MITAKNYAAQAERFISKNINFLEGVGYKKQWLDMLVKDIASAVHFVIPDEGKILDNRGRTLHGKDINLPFDKITIEFFVRGKEPMPEYTVASHHTEKDTKCLVYAENDNGNIYIVGMYSKHQEGSGEVWVISEPIPNIKPTRYDRRDTLLNSLASEVGRDKADYMTCIVGCCDAVNSKKSEVDFGDTYDTCSYVFSHPLRASTVAAWAVVELVEALSCKNISLENYQESSQSNSKRIKKGKLPFYETKMLVVNTILPTLTATKSTRNGYHSSPRQHLRRGHIRRLPSGNIWVNSCVVGDHSRGRIEKQYVVL